MYARGASDDKGNLFLTPKVVEAFAALRGRPPIGLIFLFGGEEEIGSPHLLAFIQEHKGLLHADAVVSADSVMWAHDAPSLVLGSKGLIYIRDGASYVVTASNGGRQRHPGWLFNVQSLPQVTIQVQDRQVSAVAEIAGPDKRRELWARLTEIAPFYAGYEKRTSREIPMVILRPVDEQRP